MHCSYITAILNSQDRTISVIDDLTGVLIDESLHKSALDRKCILWAQLNRQKLLGHCRFLRFFTWDVCVLRLMSDGGCGGVSIAPPPCCDVSPWRPRHCCGGPQQNAATATTSSDTTTLPQVKWTQK
ncbi:hypothetical protein TcasGA2_TC014558 [Tribolium castaneum]|uniref:Uncharacterized protein n=1 Tax=Tribolium castaneum TaxID=7070 RepID=D6WMH4_TRICA|nr:hypothetical protein TcasGA2_TC014558 [Tribolium castaneum]